LQRGRGSKGELYGALGRVDAGLDHFAGLAVHTAGTQVAHLPRAELSDARMADPHATAERQLRAGALAGVEDRLLAIRHSVDVALGEADRAAGAALAVADARVGLEVLHVQAGAIAVALEAPANRLEQPGRPAQEGLSLAPVRAQLVERLGRHPPVLAGVLLVQAVAGLARVQLAQLVAEDHALGDARAVQVDGVGRRAFGGKRAEHAHDRRDSAARTDEQQTLGSRLGQHERPFDPAEADDRSGAYAAEQKR